MRSTGYGYGGHTHQGQTGHHHHHGMYGGGKPAGPSAPAQSTLPRPNLPKAVKMRVCDLRILSHHTPVGAAAFSSSSSPAAVAPPPSVFVIDGLYVVLRCGDQVCRTSCLAYSEDPPANDGQPRDEDDDEDEDEGYGQFNGSVSGGSAGGAVFDTRPPGESELACLVWDELFDFPLEKDPGDDNDGDLAAAGVGPSLDVELWRSTPAAESCIGRYSYCVPAELLVHWTQAFRGDAKAQLQLQLGLPPEKAESRAVVDKIAPLLTASATAGDSPSIVPYDSSNIKNIRGGGSGSAVKLAVRLRVHATGIALPVGRGGGVPSSGMAIMAAGPGATQGYLHPHHGGGFGDSSSGGHGYYSPYGGGGILSGMGGGGPATMQAGHSPSTPAGGMLDPLLSGLLNPMALRSSLMAASAPRGGTPISGGLSPMPGPMHSDGFFPQPQGYAAQPPPLFMPGATSGMDFAGGGGAGYPYNNLSGGGVLDGDGGPVPPPGAKMFPYAGGHHRQQQQQGYSGYYPAQH